MHYKSYGLGVCVCVCVCVCVLDPVWVERYTRATSLKGLLCV